MQALKGLSVNKLRNPCFSKIQMPSKLEQKTIAKKQELVDELCIDLDLVPMQIVDTYETDVRQFRCAEEKENAAKDE